jgi:hypothetical protein
MYASTATEAAIERAADERIIEQHHQIEVLRARLTALGGANSRLEAELTAAQEHFVQELAARDHAYAREIAIFRSAVTNIASTPEGERALRMFNSGHEQEALGILDELHRANDRARQARTEAEDEAENRQGVLLLLEARARANLGQRSRLGTLLSDTQEPTDDEADRLILEGDLAGARRHLDITLAASQERSRQGAGETTTIEIANIHDRLGDVANAQGDGTGARQHYNAALTIRRELVTSNPDDPLMQRALGIELYKSARLGGGGASWDDVLHHFEMMQSRGLLAQRDGWVLSDLRARAGEHQLQGSAAQR